MQAPIPTSFKSNGKASLPLNAAGSFDSMRFRNYTAVNGFAQPSATPFFQKTAPTVKMQWHQFLAALTNSWHTVKTFFNSFFAKKAVQDVHEEDPPAASSQYNFFA